MMTIEEALKKAGRIPLPVGGEVVKMKLEVLLAFMKINGLKPKGWTGGVLVLQHGPADESAGEG